MKISKTVCKLESEYNFVTHRQPDMGGGGGTILLDSPYPKGGEIIKILIRVNIKLTNSQTETL